MPLAYGFGCCIVARAACGGVSGAPAVRRGLRCEAPPDYIGRGVREYVRERGYGRGERSVRAVDLCGLGAFLGFVWYESWRVLSVHIVRTGSTQFWSGTPEDHFVVILAGILAWGGVREKVGILGGS